MVYRLQLLQELKEFVSPLFLQMAAILGLEENHINNKNRDQRMIEKNKMPVAWKTASVLSKKGGN